MSFLTRLLGIQPRPDQNQAKDERVRIAERRASEMERRLQALDVDRYLYHRDDTDAEREPE